MRAFVVIISLVAVIVSVGGEVEAITYSGTAPITRWGQSSEFTVDPVLEPVAAGTFTITARGDYSVEWPIFESVESWNIDSVISDSHWSSANADSYTRYWFEDVWWTRTVSVSVADLQAITADGMMTVEIHNTGGVDYVAATDYVSWQLTFPEVPEPATVFLLGAGVLGLVGIGRKRLMKK